MAKEDFNVAEFRSLVRKGIGNRTQKEFSERTGIRQETLSRILNNDSISRPNISTLQKMSRCMLNVSYDELLVSCGYEADTNDGVLRLTEKKLVEAVSALGNVVCRDVEEYAEKLLKVFPDPNAKYLVQEDSVSDNSDNCYPQAEKKVTVKYTWDLHSDKRFWAKLLLNVYFSELKSGNLIIAGADFPADLDSLPFEFRWREKNSGLHSIAIDRLSKSAEERLLESIFGRDTDENAMVSVPTVRPGYGFYLDGVPEGFRDFVVKHASLYCVDSERTKKFRELVDTDKDPNEIFVDDEDGWNGVGGVIAWILSQETGKDFWFWDKTSEMPDTAQSTVMLELTLTESEGKMSKELVTALYKACSTLKIKKFGTVYFQEMFRINRNLEYNTEEMYLA